MWAPVYSVSNILFLKVVFGLAQICFSPGSSGASSFSSPGGEMLSKIFCLEPGNQRNQETKINLDSKNGWAFPQSNRSFGMRTLIPLYMVDFINTYEENEDLSRMTDGDNSL